MSFLEKGIINWRVEDDLVIFSENGQDIHKEELSYIIKNYLKENRIV